MSFFVIKTVLGWFFLLMGVTAAASMLTVMGKQEKKMPASTLRKIHKSAGRMFFLLMLINAVIGFRFWVISGDTLSMRAVLHVVLALGLVIILSLKVSIIKAFKNLLRYAPTLGMLVFSLGFVVFLISGGYFTARTLAVEAGGPASVEPAAVPTPGNAENGSSFFAAQCSACHFADREEAKFGPGLTNLLKKQTLPSSGRPATLENVKSQILKPYQSMPAFTNFSDKEMADLLAYLKML
jgi:mono/diheme cytochrome c family protein